jgi:hypothetical protein
MNPFLCQMDAFCKITGVTGVVTCARGCSAIRIGIGHYLIVLDQARDNHVFPLAVSRTPDRTVYVAYNANQRYKDIFIRSVGGPPINADADIDFALFRMVH